MFVGGPEVEKGVPSVTANPGFAVWKEFP